MLFRSIPLAILNLMYGDDIEKGIKAIGDIPDVGESYIKECVKPRSFVPFRFR